jgi:hypothetical protein
MFRNDTEIEVRVYKDRIVIVRKNDVFEKGGAVNSEKKILLASENHHRDP